MALSYVTWDKALPPEAFFIFCYYFFSYSLQIELPNWVSMKVTTALCRRG
ncbi:hypothetical protein RchiOBHm_Chr6g0275131 [Rosa chinensis]|uniref:Uncharacterized protein n=1 Tax=Rosa chinensis TaxID=74649 RepID=A0A2P6PRY9_ROSCH|nr:hypothetical protein RchiOBHm_Chr6g0275131 [Rosa chinensis]